MSFEEYLREKAAESRQKEITGFLLILLGVMMLVGGFLTVLVTVGDPDWFLFIPWKRTSDPTSLASLSMTLSGFVLAFAGAMYIIFASADRGWYLSSLKEALEDTPKTEEEMFKKRIRDLKRKIENLRDGVETE